MKVSLRTENYLKGCVCVCVSLILSNSATPWTVACQAPLSREFSRQEYWSGLPFPSPVDLPNPGIKPKSPISQADSFLREPPGKPSQFSDIIKIQLLLGRKLRHTIPYPRPLFASPEKHLWVVSDYEKSFSIILQTVLKSSPQTLSWLMNDIKS